MACRQVLIIGGIEVGMTLLTFFASVDEQINIREKVSICYVLLH